MAMNDTTDVLSCGHSLDELSDYLAAGKQPADPYIDACAECQNALLALEQLNSLTAELVDYDTQEHSEADSDWLGSIFSNIALEARSGRDIPLVTAPVESDKADVESWAAPDEDDELSQSEGAVISLIRSAGDQLENAMIGRCRLEGNVTDPGAEIRVDIRVTASWGQPLQGIAQQLRKQVREVLAMHTQLRH